LSQEDLAARAGTSRTTISAYERGRKSPTLATATRLVETAGYQLTAEPIVHFTDTPTRRGKPLPVADRLWRLPLREAFGDVTLPMSVNWSRPGTTYRLRDRRQRARCYEIVLREGTPPDLLRYIDGGLLLDLWPELVLPREVRVAWQPTLDAALA
jgi:transcriptional regulator with XRE-family HTH domain